MVTTRYGILTSGGDCPGLNAVIRAVVRKAERVYGAEVVGFRDAWRGVLQYDYELLDVARCRGILPRGGTILGTSRETPFGTEGGLERVREVIDWMDLAGFIVVGGNGSLACAAELHAAGINCIGVPKTIDNDIAATELTFGFDTAVSIATEAIGRLHSTAESHHRVLVVEVMGRSTGHIAVRAGLAGGASYTLIPEVPFDIDRVVEAIERRRSLGSYATLIVVAEGAQPLEGSWTIPEYVVDQFGHRRLGGIGSLLAAEIEERTGIEARVTILGHVQRGGTPTAFDRVLATRYGIAAIEAAHDGAWGQMVALRADRIERVSLAEATASVKQVDPELIAVAAEFFS